MVELERMRRWIAVLAGAVVLTIPLAATAGNPAGPAPTPTPGPSQVGVSDRPEGEPIFFRWLDPKDPVDATILAYWTRYESNTLKPREMVDLGTMLFERGWPKDAVKVYKAAAEADPGLYEAWFKAGLVEHSQRNLGTAKKYYKKCLKILVGNGWCNFYMGLAEEQSFDGSAALKYYGKAFGVDPELADPHTNPAVLESRIARAAAFVKETEDRFRDSMPMGYLEPKGVEKTRAGFEKRAREKKKRQHRATAKAGKKQGHAKPHAPPTPHPGTSGGIPRARPWATPRPAPTVKPKGSNQAHVAPRQQPKAPPHRAPPLSVAPRTAAPPRPAAPTPHPRGGGAVYPWGGGPIPPQTGSPPSAGTPAPKPTPRPEKKK